MGAFAFNLLPAGTYYVSLSHPGYASIDDEILVLADASTTFPATLIATNSTISGHVEGPEGSPIVGEWVNATSEGSWGGAQTDENGDYVIYNLAGVEHTVYVGGVSTAFEYQEQLVNAVAREDVQADTLSPRPSGYLTGMVYGPDGEYYTATVCATLYSSKSKKPVAEVQTYGEHYGDGTYAFDKVKPGTYTVGFRDCDDDPSTKFDKVFLGGAETYKDATFVTIEAAQDSFQNDVTLALR